MDLQQWVPHFVDFLTPNLTNRQRQEVLHGVVYQYLGYIQMGRWSLGTSEMITTMLEYKPMLVVPDVPVQYEFLPFTKLRTKESDHLQETFDGSHGIGNWLWRGRSISDICNDGMPQQTKQELLDLIEQLSHVLVKVLGKNKHWGIGTEKKALVMGLLEKGVFEAIYYYVAAVMLRGTYDPVVVRLYDHVMLTRYAILVGKTINGQAEVLVVA